MQRPRIFFAAVSLALPFAFHPGQTTTILPTLPMEIGEASSFELALTDGPEQPPVVRELLPEKPQDRSETTAPRPQSSGAPAR